MAILALADLKTHLGISDTTDDTTLTSAVNAVDQAVKQWCGREFDDAGSASARVFYPVNTGLVLVDDFHTTTGLVVETDEGDDGTFETTWTIDTDFQVEPLNGRAAGVVVPYNRIVAVESRSFPVSGRRPSVQVTARWGWSAIPAAVKEAALIKAARVWKRKDSIEGVAGFNEFGAVRLSRFEDPDVVGLLAPFVRDGGVRFPLVG